MKDTKICTAISLGHQDYLAAIEIQKQLHKKVSAGSLQNLLLLMEHNNVYTLGRRGKLSDIFASSEFLSKYNVQIHHVDRGGEVTYHGPGQLIGYPIINLQTWGGPLKYVRALEQVISCTLSDFGIVSDPNCCPTGVWVENSKIAAIGVKISRHVTTHGFALNVNPDLSFFNQIVPCGIPDSKTTSMADQIGDNVNMQAVIPTLVEHFEKIFGFQIEWGKIEDESKIVMQTNPS